MTPEEAIALLKAHAGARPEDWPHAIYPEAKSLIFRAAPALLKLASLAAEVTESKDLTRERLRRIPGERAAALTELVKVLS